MKCAWSYLCDQCDHAGIFDLDLEVMSVRIGETVTIEELLEAFGHRLKIHKDDKLFLPTFIEFQYGVLKENSIPHQSVLRTLEKETLSEGYAKGSPTLKDKAKDKDKEKEEGESEGKQKVLAPENPNVEIGHDAKPRGALPQFRGDPDIEELLKPILHATQTLWLKSYPDEAWIKAELLKVKAWLLVNPKRKPRGPNIARFLVNWFSRGWESYRKTIPATKQDQFKAPAVVQFRAPVDCEHCDGLGRASMYPKTAQIIADAEYFACTECEHGKTISTLPTSSWAVLHGYVTRAEFRERRKGNAS